VKSVSDSQQEILKSIKELHCPDGFEVDATFGNGSFYKNSDELPLFRFDLDETLDNCTKASSEKLPLTESSVGSVVFDPPFLTYVRENRTGNGNMLMSRRYSGYWRYDELEEHYFSSLKEFHRVLGKNGIVVFKCQDIIHNHKMHPTHINVTNWACEIGFRLLDLFVLVANSRLPSPNRRGKQKHARIYHSYFLVFKKT
jgi:tRNA G10  N-methylase Trm11